MPTKLLFESKIYFKVEKRIIFPISLPTSCFSIKKKKDWKWTSNYIGFCFFTLRLSFLIFLSRNSDLKQNDTYVKYFTPFFLPNCGYSNDLIKFASKSSIKIYSILNKFHWFNAWIFYWLYEIVDFFRNNLKCIDIYCISRKIFKKIAILHFP